MVKIQKKPTKKVTVVKAVKKDNSKAKENALKTETNYKKLITLTPKILKYVEDGNNAKILNDKAVVYLKIFKLLNTSIKLLLKQNISTYSNSMFINEIISPEISKNRHKYLELRNKAIASVGGRSKFDYLVGKINDKIKEVGDIKVLEKKAKENKITAEEKEVLKFISQNKRLRMQVESIIDLKKAILATRKNKISQKHVLEIYQKAILPIMSFLSKNDESSVTELKSLNDLLKTYIKEGTTEFLNHNFGIKVIYGPKEEVFGNMKEFGARGVIGTQFVEFLVGKEGKRSMKINSGSQYLEILKENNEDLKNKIAGNPEGEPKQEIFYSRLRENVYSGHVKLLKTFGKYLESVNVKLNKNSGKIDKEILDNIKDLTKEIQFGNSTLLITGKKNTYNVKFKKTEKKDK